MSTMAHKYMNVVSVKKNGFNNLKTNKIMTLKEKFQEEPVVVYKDNFKLTNQSAELLVEIADEFAIGFFDWFNSKEAEDLMHDLVIVGEVDINTTTKELLEIYKKEKQLCD